MDGYDFLFQVEINSKSHLKKSWRIPFPVLTLAQLDIFFKKVSDHSNLDKKDTAGSDVRMVITRCSQ